MQVCLIVYDVLVDTRFLKLTIKTWKRDLAVFIANFEQNQDKIFVYYSCVSFYNFEHVFACWDNNCQNQINKIRTMCENCPMLTGNIAKGSSSLFIVNFK